MKEINLIEDSNKEEYVSVLKDSKSQDCPRASRRCASIVCYYCLGRVVVEVLGHPRWIALSLLDWNRHILILDQLHVVFRGEKGGTDFLEP